MTLRNPEADPRKILSRPTANLRWFPNLQAGMHEKPAVDELVLSITDDLRIVDLWTGDSEVKLPQVDSEEIHILAPQRTGLGFRFSMSYSVTDLKTLER